MLNPSTADAESNDPTISRCVDFASKWGMSELLVVNLFALRATDPSELRTAKDPVGPENDQVIEDVLKTVDVIVAAWGNHGTLNNRADGVRELISKSGRPVHQLGANRTGEPRHPLYVPSDAVLSPVASPLWR